MQGTDARADATAGGLRRRAGTDMCRDALCADRGGPVARDHDAAGPAPPPILLLGIVMTSRGLRGRAGPARRVSSVCASRSCARVGH